MTHMRDTQALSRPHTLRGRANTLLGLAYLAIFGVFVGLRLTLMQSSSSDVWSDPDDYLRVAQLPITSLRFWAGERVFGFPLLMKLLRYNQVAIVAAQFALATLCWALCAFAFAACMRVRGLRPIVFGLVLGFSLSLDIVQWDFLIFSESIASSLMALMIGLWLLLLRSYAAETPRWHRAALFGMVALATILWSFVRDTNPYIVLGLAGMIGLCLLCRWRKTPDRAAYLGLLALFVAIFLVQNWTADSGRRWQYPLMNVIGKRILVDQRRTAFFAANSMPTDAKVMRFRGDFAHAHGNAVFHDADMAYFRDWLDARGKATYMRFLLSNLGESLREPLREYRTILRPPLGYYGERAGLIFPSWLLVLTGLLYIRAPEPIAAITLVMLLALIVAALRSGRAVWLVPALMALLVYPSMFLAWHGDAIEVGRHSYLVGVLLRLAFWMLGCFIADTVLSWVAGRRRRGAVRLGVA